MNELADRMILSRSATTRLVDRLERDGLVDRFVCDSDRRGMEVTLTDQGREKFMEAGRIHFSGIQDRFGNHLTDEEQATITSALTRVADANAIPESHPLCPT
jgi:DNA-binding MarR family transcriptional regulator